MWAWLICLCLSVLPRLGQGFYWTTAWNESNVYPEPRSFASLSGLEDDSIMYLYGGFSHARNEWLSEVWKLQLDTAAPLWTKLVEGPLQHAALVTLGGVLLLTGGMNRTGGISNSLYRLNDNGQTWVPAKVKGDEVPQLYRHAAVSYTVGSSQRVLLCGGLNVITNKTVDTVYELSYDNSTEQYIFTPMSPMPIPLFGHSLAVRGDSEVYVSGGLSGSIRPLPTAALPSQLASRMKMPPSPNNTAGASACVFKFTRNASNPEPDHPDQGNWTVLGNSSRPTAFHASWFVGDLLYLHGGAQGPGEGDSAAPYGLQVVQVPGEGAPLGSSSNLNNLAAAEAALQLWGEVQPGSLSGAAVWVNASAPNPSQGHVWMFGGWATPQPLPLWADSYLSPQDSSLTWRLGGNSSEPHANQWLAPLQGGMAPRGAAGLMAVPMTLGGSRKLLVMGGRTAVGWTGTSPGDSALTYKPDKDFLPLPHLNDPLDSALAYQLHDMWLIDQSTGKREMIWIVKPSTQPFGSWTNPMAVGRLWDRRLLESQDQEPGGTATALYLQTEEVVCSNCSRPEKRQVVGIWRLTLSVNVLNASDGPFNANIATWRSLLPDDTNTNTVTPCYPRVLYGAAHLVSMGSPNTSYLALHGGLVANSRYLWDSASDNVCVLELTSSGSRWLRQPQFAKMPQARYRHACASRPGLGSYSMTCYGGWDPSNRRLLDDAWTLDIPAGEVGAGMTTFVGRWTVALANYTAPRPGPRMDHWMLSVRGTNNTNISSSSSSLNVPGADFSPVLLVGGSKADSSNMVESLPRQAIWLLDAAACADPDDSPEGYYKAQVWLPMQPDGELMRMPASWALAAAAMSKTESGLELWMLLAEGNKNTVGDVMVRKAVLPSNEGCLSMSLRPFCGNLSYDINAAATACWPNAILMQPDPSVRLIGDSNTLELQRSSGVVSLLDPDGAALPFGGVSFRFEGASLRASLANVWRPSTVDSSELRVVAYGKPYIYLSSAIAEQTSVLALPPSYKVYAKLQFSNGTVLSNIPTELRIRGPDLLDRKRRSLRLPGTGSEIGADTSITNSSGVAEFYVMNITAVPPTSIDVWSPINVSYMVVFTLPSNNNTQYRVMLISPREAATNSGISYTGDGVRSTLVQAELDAVYNITVDVPSNNQVAVNFYITFKSPHGTAPPASNRCWIATVSLQHMWLPILFSDDYISTQSEPYVVNLSPGSYVLEMTDNDTSLDLKPSIQNFIVPTDSRPLTVEVPMSYVRMPVSFAGVLAPGRTDSTRARHVMAHVDTITPSKVQTPFQTFMLDGLGNKELTLLPSTTHLVTFFLANLSLFDYNFTTPPLDSKGQEVSHNITLPQTLLCGVGSSQDVNIFRDKEGRFPSSPVGRIAYLSGVTCIWTIVTGQSMTALEVNHSTKLGNQTSLIVYMDNIAHDITTNVTYSVTAAVSNITIAFTSDNVSDGLMDNFVVAWKGQAISRSLPPQFIMMIAASSAAAGAMLLFLCLWHCVFRPVQMRRQQVATTMAAAASAAANATGNAAGGRSATRNRVPRRYLRMMATSIYSVKDLAAAAVVSAQAPAAASGAPANPKDFAKLCNNDGTPNGACAVDAVAAFPGQPGPTGYGIRDSAAAMMRERERSTSVFAVKSQPAAADVDTAVAAETAAAIGPVPAPPVPSSSSGPASHSEPEASGGEICSICLCEFEDGDRIKHLPCKHYYHVACIDQWLGRDITCPLCKDNVLEALKSVFGPLPPRGISARQGGRAGDEETAAAASMAGGIPGMPEPASAVVPGAEDGNAGVNGGAGALAGADLEMVVILPYETANQPAASPMGARRGARVQATTLPGSVGMGETASEGQLSVFGLPVPNPTIAGSTGTGSQIAGVPVVLVVSAATGVAAGGAGAVGPRASSAISSSFSRELRPMRRNISADLTAEQDGSSSDCASGDDTELDSTLRQHHPGSSATAATAGLPSSTANGNANARVFRIVTPSAPTGVTAAAVGAPSGGGGDGGGEGGGGGGSRGSQVNVNSGGNQFLHGLGHAPLQPSASASASTVAAAGASLFFETVGLAPSPRPVVEHVQRSPCSSGSSGTAMRWISNSSRPAAALVGGPTVHRLARAQEAQMAVAAAALSAAAAVVSSGGVNNGAGGFNAGGGGMNSWRTGSTPCGSTNGAQSFVQGLDVSASSAALSYRVHNNPLALGSAGSRSDVSSPRAIDVAPAGDRPSGSGSPATAALAAPPSSSALRSADSVVAPPHAISVFLGSQVHSRLAAQGTSPRRPSSAGSAGMQPRAVPDVSASTEDIIQVTTTASHAQQHPQQGRATVTGLGSLAGGL